MHTLAALHERLHQLVALALHGLVHRVEDEATSATLVFGPLVAVLRRERREQAWGAEEAVVSREEDNLRQVFLELQRQSQAPAARQAGE